MGDDNVLLATYKNKSIKVKKITELQLKNTFLKVAISKNVTYETSKAYLSIF